MSPKGRKGYMKLIQTTLIAIIVLIALGTGYITVQKAIEFQAVDNCLAASKASFKNAGGQQVTVPDNYWFNFCMKEKKLK
jgi:hypothetical protein